MKTLGMTTLTAARFARIIRERALAEAGRHYDTTRAAFDRGEASRDDVDAAWDCYRAASFAAGRGRRS